MSFVLVKSENKIGCYDKGLSTWLTFSDTRGFWYLKLYFG
jgi:hypothetical protein